MRIKVTDKDIKEGIPCDIFLCPVIRAIRRETGYPRAALTNCDCVWMSNSPVWLPQDEVCRIQIYDKTGEMLPHEFELIVAK